MHYKYPSNTCVCTLYFSKSWLYFPRDELELLKATIEEQGQGTQNLYKRQEESVSRACFGLNFT